jgi:GT2 family glycosyltransferase/tetratricopeptide (TPR) repeat protein
MARVAAAYCLHDDTDFLAASVKSIELLGRENIYTFISDVAWNGACGEWEAASQLANVLGINIVRGTWPNEVEHRAAVHVELSERGYDYVLVIDTDEIIESELLENILKVSESGLADKVHVTMETYWKDHAHRIRPREQLFPVILASLTRTRPDGIRTFSGGREILFTEQFGVMHHLSYAGSDERIHRKINSWSHRHEVIPGWFEKVWKGWDRDMLMRNLHPTHPSAYGFVEHIYPPQLLENLVEEIEPICDLDFIGKHNLSVVIPVHGEEDALRECLTSLSNCSDLIDQIIVIDNASPDNAARIAESFADVQLIRNASNLGFAAASNQGAALATSEYILFLNSDTVACRDGLIRLIESLEASGIIAAVGPYSNQAGYEQGIEPTYTSIETMPLFGGDFARRNAPDVDVDHLVGLCLLVRKSAFNEVGGFDERFGLGLYEDTDLCYRLRREGYRLSIAARSFIHHEGSMTLRHLGDPMQRLYRNRDLFFSKWREDVESGFASHLPSTKAERIEFRFDKKPETRRQLARAKAGLANISLCMIVKNEERVLGDCLASAEPYFKEIIVVDTGSTDNTKKIAQRHGASVFEFPWTDSFAEARNESLRHATGDWIFWLDADDTLPLATGEALLDAATSAPKHLDAFIVPVQFVDDGPNAGTRVDHVKLFRNRPGLSFEGRIHEQILPSIRRQGAEVGRLNAVVLHSGYDTSVEGQQRKRVRDFKLLELDIAERPNHPFVLFNFGMTHHYVGNHEDAIDWFRRSIAASNVQESHVRKAYVLLAQSLRALGMDDEAFSTLLEADKLFPDDQEIPFHLGIAYTARGQYGDAITCYERVLKSQPATYFSSLDAGLSSFKTLHNLGVVSELAGNYAEARKRWLQAIEAAPSHLESALALFGAAINVTDFSTAKSVLAIVHMKVGETETYCKLLDDYYVALLGPNDAAEHLEVALLRNPSSVGLRLVLARRLIANEQVQAALPHLHVLSEQGVAEGAYCLGIEAIRTGRMELALRHMEHALRLNPNHEPTSSQVRNLRRALSTTPPAEEH